MWWFWTALAGNVATDLDRGATRWLAGKPVDKAFRGFEVQMRPTLRRSLIEAGVVELGLAGMELELKVGARRLLLVLDPRKPSRPVMQSARVRSGQGRTHPLSTWERRAPGVAKLSRKVLAGLRESSCPARWRSVELDLPAGVVPSPGDPAGQVCDAALAGALTAIGVDDVGWWAFDAAGDPIGVVRGELELRRGTLTLSLDGLRRFE